MPVLETQWSVVYVVAVAVLLGLAAWRDVLTRTVPDGISIALLLLGSAFRFADGLAPLALSWGVAIAMFFALLPLCARGLLGGADLKLLCALAVGLSPQSSLHLLLDVTLCGGVLATIYLAACRLLPRPGLAVSTPARARSWLRRLASVEHWRIHRGAPLPYGVAIAVGAVIALTQQQGA